MMNHWEKHCSSSDGGAKLGRQGRGERSMNKGTVVDAAGY